MITKCRICGYGPNFLSVPRRLGTFPLSDFSDKPDPEKFSLDIVYCAQCGSLQLSDEVNRHKLYRKYWYESSLNPVIQHDLKEIADLVQGDSICDIACNDGTLLSYVSSSIVKYGVDPSDVSKKAEQYGKIYHEYWEGFNEKILFDTITAIACLYDLPDPDLFIENIKNHLSPDGIFISQLMTLYPMILNMDFSNICHEHIEYYSYKGLVQLFERNGLEIYKVETNPMNGGSYRLFAHHFQKKSIKVDEIYLSHADIDLFFNTVDFQKRLFENFLGKNKGKVYGYGASTKSNTILSYYGLSNKDIPAIVDINPRKIGKYTSTGIPITGEIPSDCEYLWVFPYGFFDYFRKKETQYKGKWITTIPRFQIC